jgi:hypothetical protein
MGNQPGIKPIEKSVPPHNNARLGDARISQIQFLTGGNVSKGQDKLLASYKK